ncbi:DUF3226 domain-containing protein [Pedobacter flavus]|uniref:DUF3226 domain-containing protein n=1 Tax=Pedobacter flavus TaxID=3113906 RepID=A0ABU7GZ87_9SPHI|nr:DUF3226 domain-containing protein [Pedobacter sp. VNH31]MEE1884377.1 DUF3226 domain-containing protein [Pedobacter sp. VNH31]
MNVIVCLLEGPHDAAFLYKILKTNGYSEFRKPIKALPGPIFGFLTNPKHHSDLTVSEMTYDMANRRIYPFDVLIDENEANCILLYPLMGVQNAALREKIIKSIDDVVVLGDDGAADFSEDHKYVIAYLVDADNDGVEERLNSISEELMSFFPDIKVDVFKENGTVQIIGDLEIGVFVITEIGSQTGRLEDILIPLMKLDNDDIFSKAEEFLGIHEQTNLFKGKVERYENGIIKKINNVKYDYKKSLVATVGQLQKSGMSNTVCIKQTDYLETAKIQANESCRSIVNFLNKIIK